MIEPHGGCLINRVLSKKAGEALQRSCLPRFCVGDDSILDIEKIAIGAYSPLIGFMCKEDVMSVVHRMRLANGEVWTIPIVLPVDARAQRLLAKRGRCILCDMQQNDVAVLQVRDIFSLPKNVLARKVYGTDDAKHPGVQRLYAAHSTYVGGEISLITRPHFAFERYNLDPADIRAIIKQRGWKTVAGFQTRNVPHRAHEYLQKLALSLTDGILIHPIIGWKKDGDFRPDAVIRAYQHLIRLYFPRNRVIFAGLATAMRYAGPREAVFHAIIRKNYGCTHFIVGRDHAGVGDYYEKYEAHRIFDTLPAIGITPLLLRGPYYCMRCRDVVSDKICPHPERWHKHISGTIIRNLMMQKKQIPPYLMRPEIVALIRVCQKKSGSHKGWCL